MGSDGRAWVIFVFAVVSNGGVEVVESMAILLREIWARKGRRRDGEWAGGDSSVRGENKLQIRNPPLK